MTGLLFSESQLTKLGALADALLPGDPENEFRSASELDPKGRILARSIPLIPRQSASVAQMLDRVDVSDPVAALTAIQEGEPEAFSALLTLVFGTYLTNRKIWKRMGYPGRRPMPTYPDEFDYFLADGLLDPVVQRGAFYRPTPS